MPYKDIFCFVIKIQKTLLKKPTDFIHLFWTENGEQADQKYISTRLDRLIHAVRTNGATVNSITHASSIELLTYGFNERTRNIFTHHTPYSKISQQHYTLAVNRVLDSIAAALVKNHGEKITTQIISKQRGDARVSDGDGLQQSPLEDDLQLSPQESLASPLSLPIISTQTIVETEHPNDHESAKIQKSQLWRNVPDMKPQEQAKNSSMTKDSDRATTAEAQK
ncbi:MAG: hypothetical protein EZS28_052630 [Streblomastix strix]|uniref:Tyr recombinase domain-containing protein n=1 Tax=Streblomastix strix TaxID=222440 RepID=A0A5J4S053_9EUKA|nr:MAG: hypothetical protein EZS28_052630 [Streblomastix strix]